MNSETGVKHIPLRRCVACRQAIPKSQLTRFVKTAEHGIQLDRAARQPGRGAYLCSKPECVFKALKKHLLERALKASLSVEAEIELKQRTDPQN